VCGRGEGAIVSVMLDDLASERAHQAATESVEGQ
jgi:hypothetical protein